MSAERGTLFLLGATGHTGSRIAARMLAEGWRLRCLVHTQDRAVHIPRDERVEIVPGDVTQPEAWRERVCGVAAVIHMTHVGFAGWTAAACEWAGVRRLVAMSSTRRFTRFPEETARLVIEGEAALEASSLDYTIIRPTMIFGGDRDNNLEKVVRWLRRHRVFPLVAGGIHRVQPIFVQDLVEAIARTVERPETFRRAFNVAGPEPLTQQAMIETIARAMEREVHWVPVPYGLMMVGAYLSAVLPGVPLKPPQVRRMLEDKTFDISEARKLLGGWQPRPFEEAIRLKLAGKA